MFLVSVGEYNWEICCGALEAPVAPCGAWTNWGSVSASGSVHHSQAVHQSTASPGWMNEGLPERAYWFPNISACLAAPHKDFIPQVVQGWTLGGHKQVSKICLCENNLKILFLKFFLTFNQVLKCWNVTTLNEIKRVLRSATHTASAIVLVSLNLLFYLLAEDAPSLCKLIYACRRPLVWIFPHRKVVNMLTCGDLHSSVCRRQVHKTDWHRGALSSVGVFMNVFLWTAGPL